MTTWCPDTPETRAEFQRLLAQLSNPRPAKPKDRQQFNAALQHQISRENRYLRSLRTFLPGYEPDRFRCDRRSHPVTTAPPSKGMPTAGLATSVGTPGDRIQSARVNPESAPGARIATAAAEAV